MTEIENGLNMKMSESIKLAAVGLVHANDVVNCEQVPGVPGIYVAKAPAANIQTMDAIREGGIEYVIGPLRNV
jgi:hypothetical protein